ncbi:hypothetical protein PMAYCL1PPCAC_00004, partial [Pristionchus mayeri]
DRRATGAGSGQEGGSRDVALHDDGARKLNMPRCYIDIISDIRRLNFWSKGCYREINRHLDKFIKADKINMHLPLDWVGKKHKSPEKRKLIEPVVVELVNIDNNGKKTVEDAVSSKNRVSSEL